MITVPVDQNQEIVTGSKDRMITVASVQGLVPVADSNGLTMIARTDQDQEVAADSKNRMIPDPPGEDKEPGASKEDPDLKRKIKNLSVQSLPQDQEERGNINLPTQHQNQKKDRFD